MVHKKRGAYGPRRLQTEDSPMASPKAIAQGGTEATIASVGGMQQCMAAPRLAMVVEGLAQGEGRQERIWAARLPPPMTPAAHVGVIMSPHGSKGQQSAVVMSLHEDETNVNSPPCMSCGAVTSNHRITKTQCSSTRKLTRDLSRARCASTDRSSSTSGAADEASSFHQIVALSLHGSPRLRRAKGIDGGAPGPPFETATRIEMAAASAVAAAATLAASGGSKQAPNRWRAGTGNNSKSAGHSDTIEVALSCTGGIGGGSNGGAASSGTICGDIGSSTTRRIARDNRTRYSYAGDCKCNHSFPSRSGDGGSDGHHKSRFARELSMGITRASPFAVELRHGAKISRDRRSITAAAWVHRACTPPSTNYHATSAVPMQGGALPHAPGQSHHSHANGHNQSGHSVGTQHSVARAMPNQMHHCISSHGNDNASMEAARHELRSFAALRTAADMPAGAQQGGNTFGGLGGGAGTDAGTGNEEQPPRNWEEARLRRARQRAQFLVQREEEAQTRAEVYALNRLMRRREILRFDTYVRARKLDRKRARAMRLATETGGEASILASMVTHATPEELGVCLEVEREVNECLGYLITSVEEHHAVVDILNDLAVLSDYAGPKVCDDVDGATWKGLDRSNVTAATAATPAMMSSNEASTDQQRKVVEAASALPMMLPVCRMLDSSGIPCLAESVDAGTTTVGALRFALPSNMRPRAATELLVVSSSAASTARVCHEVHAVASAEHARTSGRASHRMESLCDDWQTAMHRTSPTTDARGDSLCPVGDILLSDPSAVTHHQIDRGSKRGMKPQDVESPILVGLRTHSASDLKAASSPCTTPSAPYLLQSQALEDGSALVAFSILDPAIDHPGTISTATSTSSLPSLPLSRQSSAISLPALALLDEAHSSPYPACLSVAHSSEDADSDPVLSASLPHTVVRQAATRVAAVESGMEVSVVEAATEAALAATEVGAGKEAARIAAEEAAAVAIGKAAVKAVLSRVTKAAERAAKVKGAGGHGSQNHPRPERSRCPSGTAMNHHHNSGGSTPILSGRSDKVQAHAIQSRHESRTRRTPGARGMLSRPNSVRVGGV